MKDFAGIFFNDWSYALGWTLLHSLWQCFLILLFTLACLRLIPGMRSSVRYVVACCGFLLMMLSSVMTFVYTSLGNAADEPVSSSLPATQVDSMVMLSPTGIPDNFSLLIQTIQSNLPVIVALWALGFLFFSLRLAGGIYCSWKIRSTASPVDEKWNAFAANARQKLGIDRLVSIGESVNISTPVVLGYIKPLILLPVGMLSGLTTEQLETIIVHELAHIRRNDYLVNLIQSIFETVFFFNPSVRVLSSEIRKEREYCCDDVVVRYHGGSRAYASALVQIAEAQLNPSGFAIALADDNKQLLNRIKRIIERSGRNYSRGRRIIIPALLILSGLLCISWLGSGRADFVDHRFTAQNDTIPEKKGKAAHYLRKSIITLDENGQPHEEIVEEFEGDESLRPLMKPHIPPVPHADVVPPQMPMLAPDTIPPAPFGLRNREEWDAFSKSFEEHFRKTFEDLYGKLDGDSALFPHFFDDDFHFPDLESFKVQEEALRALENLEHSETLRKLDEKLQHLRDLELDRFHEFDRRFELHEKDSRSYENVLRKELEEDGYIKKGEPIESLQWSNDSFKVNGKSIRKSHIQKYRELNDGFFKPEAPGQD